MKYNEHMLTYKAHKDNPYLDELLAYANECAEDEKCNEAMYSGTLYKTKTYGWHVCDEWHTPNNNYNLELHYAKGRQLYPNKDCESCDVEDEYLCFNCEVSELEMDGLYSNGE